MPSGWLHQVTSLDPTISVSGNFVNGSNLGVFMKDACRAMLDNFRQRRQRLPPALAESLTALAQAVENGKLTSSSGGATISGSWPGRDLRLTGRADGMSWTLSNYKHGRKYTSFFADRRTDLAAVGLTLDGQTAAEELLSLSPRREIGVIVGLTTANVSRYRTLLDAKSANDRALGALDRLTASFAPAAESTAVGRA